jgi:hypothetical protein
MLVRIAYLLALAFLVIGWKTTESNQRQPQERNEFAIQRERLFEENTVKSNG